MGAVFPHVMIFADNDLGNLIAVASTGPIEPDFAKMEQRYREPAIREDLARLGMPNLAALLSHHRVSQKSFAALLGPGPLNMTVPAEAERIGVPVFAPISIPSCFLPLRVP